MSKSTISPTEAVLAALAAGPADAGEVAVRAGIGRSTAGKALVALVEGGAVERVSGGREGSRRLPDSWSLPATPGDLPSAHSGAPTEPATSNRLAKGELRSQVLAYLHDNPGEHSPTTVAKALDGRSSGAVANALAKRGPEPPLDAAVVQAVCNGLRQVPSGHLCEVKW